MGRKLPAVDAYIERAAPFARPILRKVRALFHKALPEVEERIRWGFPNFDQDGILGGMAAFKAHATFGLWRTGEIPEARKLFSANSPMGAGKLVEISQLAPDAALVRAIRAAARLNASGVRPKRTSKARKPPRMPAEFSAALAKSPKARAGFEKLAPGYRREYVEWIAEAKRPETRAKRLATALDWIAKGRSRNWKYQERC